MAGINLQLQTATAWSYRPYRPGMADRGEIYIERIVPQEHSIQIEWTVEDAAKAVVFWRKREEGDYCRLGVFTGGQAEITGLEENCDYQFYVESDEGGRSLVRLARTGDYLAVPIQYLHPEDPAYAFSGRYLCSPSIVRQLDGSLLASMDLYGPGMPQNLTLVYRSDDNGRTWHWQCELFPCCWGKLFVFHGEVYMMAASTEHGDLLLGKTTDGGKSFETPVALVRSSGLGAWPGVDCSPEPPVEYGGRLWINFHWGDWTRKGQAKHFPCVASAPADSDILNPANWTISELCPYDANWPGTAKGPSGGTLEATFAVLPDGKLYMLARYHLHECEPDHGLAVLYRVRTEDPSAPPEYVRTVSFDGNHSKFTVLRDGQAGDYYSIISRIRGSRSRNDRNLLSLVKSQDCVSWRTAMDIFDLTDRDPLKNGVQYVDFFLEDDKIYYACRTGINGANDYHNTNVTLFGIIENIREL